MADRVVILDQGRIAQTGTPEDVFQRPQSPYVASFMGAENIVDAEAVPEGGAMRLRVAGAAAAQVACIDALAGPVQAHFRSEMASLRQPGLESPDSLHLPGRISQVSYLGLGYRCEIDTGCGRFFIDHPNAVAAGENVTVCVPAHALHVYPRDPARGAAPPQ